MVLSGQNSPLKFCKKFYQKRNSSDFWVIFQYGVFKTILTSQISQVAFFWGHVVEHYYIGSMSGPREPSLDSCQDITPTYPPTPPTSGPTGSPTTTPPICNVTMGTLCDSHNNVILEVEHLSTPSDCQSICQNHQECNWWSHWVEEGGEHWWVWEFLKKISYYKMSKGRLQKKCRI